MDAVIAHEIGHIKKKHLVYYLVLLLGFFIMAYAMIHIVLHVLTGFPGLIGMLLNAGADPGVIFSGAFNFLFAGGFLLYFRYGFGFFMRNFERQADTYVYRLFESAGPLITTLEKIAFSSGLSPEKPNWHHFSIRERINFLMKCESDRSWIRRHETKIGRALIGYLVALAVAGTFEASLLPRQIENNFQRTLFETAIFMEIGKSPQDPALYRLLGDLYQETGNFDKAVSAYQESLSLDPENPETLNNLAWLWAACPDEVYRDPRKALLTARKAALLNPSPYILDTLAESYFVNGEYEEAIRAGKKALETAGDNPAYYENQLKKFRKAASAHGSPL
jgi:tetratricopeptide (TPR) repeat protein